MVALMTSLHAIFTELPEPSVPSYTQPHPPAPIRLPRCKSAGGICHCGRFSGSCCKIVIGLITSVLPPLGLWLLLNNLFLYNKMRLPIRSCRSWRSRCGRMLLNRCSWHRERVGYFINVKKISYLRGEKF